ncbi:MAG: hypothetical protein KF817_05090 [Phycisphaeraceae bacterium]|nr:hypothetical protein [Phycisphaeraceae bacterium]
MRDLVRELGRIQGRARLLLLTHRTAMAAAGFLAVLLLVIAFDYLLRFPAGLRALLLIGIVAGVVMVFLRVLRPALRFRPTLTQVALRCESMHPPLRGRLASSVEFVLAGTDRTSPLAARTVRETQRRVESMALATVVRQGTALAGVVALVATVLLATATWIFAPDIARIGAARLLAPFAGTEWPARTAVESLMSEVLPANRVHPRGQVLPLRARNLTPRGAHERVEAWFRLQREGEDGAWQSVLLTHQGDGIHERLIDADADAMEVYFATQDNRSPVERLRLEPPPAVERAELTIVPPAYAESFLDVRTVDLGTGTDERRRLREGVLVGSEAVLRLSLNKPVPVPGETDPDPAWLARLLEGSRPDVSADLVFEAARHDGQSRQLTLRWTLHEPARMAVGLEDRSGLRNAEPIEYMIDVAADRPPAVTLTRPERDEAILASAVVELAAEARDDVAIERLSLEAHVQRAAALASGLPPDPLPTHLERQSAARAVDLAGALDLAPAGLVPGDVVLLAAVAEDGFLADGARRAPVRSTPRRLLVVSPLDLAEQIRRGLGTVRQNAIRIESLQSELQDAAEALARSPGRVEARAVAQAQAQLSDRIAAQRESVDMLVDQAARNRLDDPQVSDLLRQSRDLLSFAGRAAAEAAGAAERVGEGAPDVPEALESLADQQQRVRDELSDLVALLDRDEDSWIVQRRLEGLLTRQEAISEVTDAVNARTRGMDQSDLAAGEREELERLAAEQRALRDEARALVEEMRRRARALGDVDRQAGEAMQRSARMAEQREVDREMERAAERIEQNQLQVAGDMQQSARQTISRMLEELADQGRNRAEELLRRLSSLREVLERLVQAQESELMALAVAEERSDFTGRDRAMIRISQNTRSATDEARAQPPTRRIARRLQQAAEVQGVAITALRAQPVAVADARDAEERSLRLLVEALESAQDLEEEAQEDLAAQQREALLDAYRALGERQVMLREETLPLVGVETGRRQLVEARRIASVQDDIRAGLGDLLAGSEDLRQSGVFSFVHDLMDRWARQAVDALREGTVTDTETDLQRRIAESIFRQIEALEEASAPPPDFAREGGEEPAGGQGGQGGESGAGLVPPVAELRRLVMLQQQVAEETVRADAAPDAGAERRRERATELGAMQRRILELAQGLAEMVGAGRAGGASGDAGAGDGGPPPTGDVPGPPPAPDPAPDAQENRR